MVGQRKLVVNLQKQWQIYNDIHIQDALNLLKERKLLDLTFSAVQCLVKRI